MSEAATVKAGDQAQAWSLAFREHPLVPLPAAETIAEELADPARRPKLLEFLTQRASVLRAAEMDPLYHGLRLPQSRRVDELLEKYQMVYESGGKRAGKTEDAIPRFLRCCLAYGKAQRWAMQDNALSSIANLQRKFWEYLPAHIRALNLKRDKHARAKYRVHYTPDGGFDGLLILPNGCEVYFLNYTQNPSDFLGWELGKHLGVGLQRDGEGHLIPDIGALLDENCPLSWLENIQLRCATRGAKIHWCYSPQQGITPAIKELKANARTVDQAPAELLGERVNVPGCPKGTMPIVQVDEKKRLAIFYRFTEWNPFSGYANPGGVRELCVGKNDRAYTMAHAYGYCEMVAGRAFPLFGEWNVVKAAEVPAQGTNWMVGDPAGARNWFLLWARACRGGDLYVYREWPGVQDLGEWAVTSKSARKLNGERGPAQPTVGYGPREYKRLVLDRERVRVPRSSAELGVQSAEWEQALARVKDPHHRWMIEKWMEEDSQSPIANSQGAGPGAELRQVTLQEEIFERLIDPRAARNQSAADGKGIDLIQKLAEVLADGHQADGRADGEPDKPMIFAPAPGLDLRDGISQINELLYFKVEEERVAIVNAPKLYVSEECRNLIWALNNYSLPDDLDRASDDACEDPVDCLRYLVTRGVRYVEPGGRVKTRGGGSY